MTASRWRTRAAPIIDRVLRETDGKTDAEVRAALRDAYPFGQRKYHPYKIWLDEIARQRGTGKYAKSGPQGGTFDERIKLEARLAELREECGDDR